MRYWLVGVSMAAMAAPCSSAWAQPGQANARKTEAVDGLTDIIVTARRTSESAQHTPIAITALGAEALTQARITNVTQLQASTPGLVVGQNTSGGGNQISLRGQVQVSLSAENDQSVGLYVDDIYLARQQDATLDLVDVERVEVLRGPQGTLFGRNTTGGAISITTRKPEQDRTEASLDAGFGNYDAFQVTGMTNLPVADGLAVRVAARHSEHSGYGRNIVTDRGVGDDNSDYVRGAVALAPTGADWDLLLSADYRDNHNKGGLSHLLFFNPDLFGPLSASAQAAIDAPFYDKSAGDREFNHLRNYGALAKLNIDLGGATLTSISGYRGFRLRNLADLDATALFPGDNLTNTRHNQISEEVQLKGVSGTIEWITGFYYFREKTAQDFTAVQGLLDFDARITSTSFGPYGQINYQLADRLRLTAGLRYTWDRRRVVANNSLPPLGGACLTKPTLIDPGEACRATRHNRGAYPSYTISADYTLSPAILVYARSSRGNKSGGIGTTTPVLESFAPEKVVDYEVGAKATMLDNRLRTNLALFRTDYKNFQRPVALSTGTGGTAFIATQSVGKARINGLEAEVTMLPFASLELTGNLALINPRYLEFADATGDRSGEPFTFVAKTSWGLGGTYKAQTQVGELSLHLDYAYRSKVDYFPPNPNRTDSAARRAGQEPGYGVLNGRIGLDLTSLPVSLSIWAKNLAAEKYNNFRYDAYDQAGYVPGYRGDPRTFGITISYRFAS